MALQKTNIPLSLQKGVDTKRDVKQLVYGSLRKAQNAIFNTIGMLKKRNGYTRIPLRDSSGAEISNSKAIFQFNKELGVVSDNQYYGLSESSNALEGRGSLYNTKVTHIPVISNGSNHTNIDFTITNNLKAICYIDSNTKTLYYSVQDTADDSLPINNSVADTNVDNCKIAHIGSIVYLIYIKGANLYVKSFNITAPDVLSTAVSAATNVSVDTTVVDPALYFPILDAVTDGSKIFVAYNGAGLGLFSISAGGILSSLYSVSSTSYPPTGAISLLIDNSNRVVVFFSNNNYVENTEIYYLSFNYALTSMTLAPTLIKNMGVTAPNVPGIDVYDTGSAYDVKYHVQDNINDRDSYVEKVVCSYAGSVGTPSVFIRSVGLASRGFFWDSNWYSVVNYSSDLQSTLFIVDNSANLVAKIQPGTSGGHVLTGSLPKSSVDSNYAWILVQVKGLSVSENEKFYSLLGVSSIKLDFSFSNSYQNSVVGNNLHIAGGVLQMYDGGNSVEHGFHIYPEVLSEGAISDSPTQGELGAGNYGYRALYSWTDNHGQQHRSVPSTVFNVNRTIGVKATSEVSFTTPVTLTYNLNGNGYYGSGTLQALPTVNISVKSPANNPSNTVLITISGGSQAASLEITPNIGTNNNFVPVTLTSKQVVEFINTGAVVGKTLTVTNADKAFANITASGGGDEEIPSSPSGDTAIAVGAFGGAKGRLPGGTISGASNLAIWGRTPGSSQHGTVVTFKVAAPAANPGGAILVTVTGTQTSILITLTPDTTNGTLTVDRLASAINNKAHTFGVGPKVVTVTDSSNLLQYIYAGGSNFGSLTFGGGYDGYIVLSGGLAITAQPIKIPTLRLTQKQNVIVELYRTENNGSIFYKSSSISSPTINDKTVDYVTVTDSVSDEDIISREVLYTTGGVLENTGAPTCSIVAQHTASNRLLLVGEDQNTLIYSKIRNPGFPVEFNDSLSKSIDPVGGPITALSSMDEKLIIFEESAVLYISGQGPNNLGLQDTFTEPERVSVDVGCSEPKSLVLVPDGIMFKSKKGIFLLNRGLGLSYIGAEVEAYNNLEITSAKIVSEKNQVRFTTSSSTCLVYDYQEKQWGTYDNHQALDANIVNGDYYYLRSNSYLFKEDANTFSDNGTPIKLLLDTGWISFSGLQNFARVRHMLILAEYKSPHRLRVRVAYNFNEAWIEESFVDPLDFLVNTQYGEDSPYGNPIDVPYGGSTNVYQARINFTRQKCESMRICIEDVQTVAGEGLSISALNFQVGLKEGTAKLQSSRKYPTS